MSPQQIQSYHPIPIKVEDPEDEECELMAMSELSYVNRVRDIQKKKYPEKPASRARQRH